MKGGLEEYVKRKKTTYTGKRIKGESYEVRETKLRGTTEAKGNGQIENGEKK